MTDWLLDTNVLSELRRPKPEAKVVAFVTSQALDRLYISAVTLAEIRFGIELVADVGRAPNCMTGSRIRCARCSISASCRSAKTSCSNGGSWSRKAARPGIHLATRSDHRRDGGVSRAYRRFPRHKRIRARAGGGPKSMARDMALTKSFYRTGATPRGE